LLVVDTNVLVYATDADSEHHEACRRYLESRAADPSPTYVTWNICYEYLRVVTHPRVFQKPWTSVSALGFIETLLAIEPFSVLEPTERHGLVLNRTLHELPDVRGNLVHDLHTAVLMREHGINRICTRDTDFQRFSFLSIVDPLRP